MSTHEVALGLEYLTDALSSDSDLTTAAPGGVHRGIAPQGTATPYVIINFQGGSDVLTLNAFRVMASLVFQAKVCGPANDTASLVSASSALDAVIKRVQNTPLSAGMLLSCYREQPIMYDDNSIAGIQYSHFGGLYRMLIQQS